MLGLLPTSKLHFLISKPGLKCPSFSFPVPRSMAWFRIILMDEFNLYHFFG